MNQQRVKNMWFMGREETACCLCCFFIHHVLFFFLARTNLYLLTLNFRLSFVDYLDLRTGTSSYQHAGRWSSFGWGRSVSNLSEDIQQKNVVIESYQKPFGRQEICLRILSERIFATGKLTQSRKDPHERQTLCLVMLLKPSLPYLQYHQILYF